MWKVLALAFGLYWLTDAYGQPDNLPKKKDRPMTEEEFKMLQDKYRAELEERGLLEESEYDYDDIQFQDDVFQGFDAEGNPIWGAE